MYCAEDYLAIFPLQHSYSYSQKNTQRKNRKENNYLRTRQNFAKIFSKEEEEKSHNRTGQT